MLRYSKAKLQASEVVNLLCDKLFLPFHTVFADFIWYSIQTMLTSMSFDFGDQTELIRPYDMALSLKKEQLGIKLDVYG